MKNLPVDQETYARLEILAKEKGVTVRKFVNEIVEKHLQKLKATFVS